MQTQYNQARGRVGRQGRGREAGGAQKQKQQQGGSVGRATGPKPAPLLDAAGAANYFQVWGDKESTELGVGSWGKFLSPRGPAAENSQCTGTSTIPAARALLHPAHTSQPRKHQRVTESHNGLAWKAPSKGDRDTAAQRPDPGWAPGSSTDGCSGGPGEYLNKK